MMILNLFKKPYTLRRFEKVQIVRGRSRAVYSDGTVSLDVQPLTSDDIMTLPEGMRRKKNIRAFGRILLQTADEKSGTLADRLYYCGEWYECVGASMWGNTPVGQTEAVFGLIPAESGAIQIAPAMQEKNKDTDGRGER